MLKVVASISVHEALHTSWVVPHHAAVVAARSHLGPMVDQIRPWEWTRNRFEVDDIWNGRNRTYLVPAQKNNKVSKKNEYV